MNEISPIEPLNIDEDSPDRKSIKLIAGAEDVGKSGLVEHLTEREELSKAAMESMLREMNVVSGDSSLDHGTMMEMFRRWGNASRGNYHTARMLSAKARIAKRKAKRKSK